MKNLNRLLLISACAVAVTSCSSYKDYKAPEAPNNIEDISLSDNKSTFSTNKPVQLWWNELKDDTLNILITKSLKNNKDISVAIANLKQARAFKSETKYDYAPTVTSTNGYQHTRVSSHSGPGLSDRSSQSYNTGFDASWELDFFGKISAKVISATSKEQAAIASLRDINIIVAAEVASNYIQLRGLQHRLDIAKRNAENQKETYNLSARLSKAGRTNKLDLIRAQTQLELTKSTIPTLKAGIISNINKLSVLTGDTPNALNSDLIKPTPLPTIPNVINLGEVKDLLRRRPDVVNAEKNLESAIARYNVAVADQFPSVTIIGNLGFSASNFSDLDSASTISGFGPSVNWAAFNMGRVKAVIRQNDAKAESALATYEKTVLEAIADLQTSVNNFSEEGNRQQNLKKAASLSKQAAKIARNRYEAGLDPFIDVLNTEATMLDAEDSLAQSEINTSLSLISIYKALGGGWE